MLSLRLRDTVLTGPRVGVGTEDTCIRCWAPMPSQVVWTAEEDDLLRDLVEKHGTKSWTQLATYFPGKNGKQCRRRWKNTIEIDAKATIWSQEEDQKLIDWHREHGNKWTTISALFGDRTDNAVKNRWHALCRKQPDLAKRPVTEGHMNTVGLRRGTKTRPVTEGSEDWPSSAGSPYNPKRRSTRARYASVSSGGTGAMSNSSHQTPSIPTPFDKTISGNLGYNVLPRDLENLSAKDQIEVKEIKGVDRTVTQDLKQFEALLLSQSSFRDGQDNGELSLTLPSNLTDLLSGLISGRDVETIDPHGRIAGINSEMNAETGNVVRQNGKQTNVNTSMANTENLNMFPGETFSCAGSSSSFTSSQRAYLARLLSQSQTYMGGGSREGSFILPMTTEQPPSVDLRLVMTQNLGSQSFSGDRHPGGAHGIVPQPYPDIFGNLQKNRNSSVLSNRNHAIAAAIATVDQGSQPKMIDIDGSSSPRKALHHEKSLDYVEIDKMFEQHDNGD